MSDGGTGEKTEEASPQKLKQARDKGQVAKSQDANPGAELSSSSSTSDRPHDGQLASTSCASSSYGSARVGRASGATRRSLLMDVVDEALWATLIIARLPASAPPSSPASRATTCRSASCSPSEPLKPDIKKLNPVDGFKNLFSKKKLVESLKQIIKFVARVSWVVYDGASKDSMREVVPLASRIDLWTGVAARRADHRRHREEVSVRCS
jgi:hypothetical protein